MEKSCIRAADVLMLDCITAFQPGGVNQEVVAQGCD